MREVTSTDPKFVAEAVFSNRLTQETTARSGILLTFFVTILLGVGTMVFSYDVSNLVIEPIEVMVSLVHRISQNPAGYV